MSSMAVLVACSATCGITPRLQREMGRRGLLVRAAALSVAPRPSLAAVDSPERFENSVIGFSFNAPPTYKRQVAGGLFGRAAEALAFGGAVTYNGAEGATIDLTTQTLPPGPQYARLDPTQWSADDAADSILEGEVLSKELRRFGDCDAWIFESRTRAETGYTVATLKKDRCAKSAPVQRRQVRSRVRRARLHRHRRSRARALSNFANHLVVLSAHAPNPVFERVKPELLAAVGSLVFVDFASGLADADLKVARPFGGGSGGR